MPREGRQSLRIVLRRGVEVKNGAGRNTGKKTWRLSDCPPARLALRFQPPEPLASNCFEMSLPLLGPPGQFPIRGVETPRSRPA